MKIQMDAADIEKLLAAYCPQKIQHSGDTFRIRFGQRQIVLGHTELTLKTELDLGNIKGDLNGKLTGNRAEISVGLK